MIRQGPAPLPTRQPVSADDISARRRMAQMLMQEGTSAAPVQHWTQALARVVQAGVGGMNASAASEQGQQREAYDEQQSTARRMAERVAAMDDFKAKTEYQRNLPPTEEERLELDVKRAQLEKLRQPDVPSLPQGYRWKPDGTGMEAIPGGPAAQPPKKSVTELKQIHAADDAVPVLDQTVDTLKKAEDLISEQAEKDGIAAYEGTGAGWAGYIGARTPGGSFLFDEKRSKSTDEWGTIMNMEAIKSMAENLKGATTNFELQEFVRILADPSQPREIRRRTLQRMRSLAENQRNLARRRAEEIRSGEYYRPEAGGAGASGIIDLGGGFSVEVE